LTELGRLDKNDSKLFLLGGATMCRAEMISNNNDETALAKKKKAATKKATAKFKKAPGAPR
jgi:hypothetical protein